MKRAIVIAGVFSPLLAAAAFLSTDRKTAAPNDPHWQRWVRPLVCAAADNDHFGRDVALDGDAALLGAPLSDQGAINTGAACFFAVRDLERPVALRQVHPTRGAAFAWSVDLDGEWALAGCPGDGDFGVDAGSATLFRKGAAGRWSAVTRLVADDLQAGDWFGVSVALDGPTAFVGAQGASRSGAVYVFEQQPDGDWRQTAKLAPESAQEQCCFGLQLAAGGGLVVVGAPGANDGDLHEAGAAYVFQQNGESVWKTIARLAAPTPSWADRFGHAVAVSGRTIAIGSRAAAQVFAAGPDGVWRHAAAIRPQGLSHGVWFAHALALSGRTLAVGVPSLHQGAGAVFLFQQRGDGAWRQVMRLAVSGEPEIHWFGASLALSGRQLLIGAPCGRGSTAVSGSAYLIDLAMARAGAEHARGASASLVLDARSITSTSRQSESSDAAFTEQ